MEHQFNHELVEQYDFIKVWCEQGHKITSWKEGDDIKDYHSFIIAYCPKDTDLSIYHCVTDEEDQNYLELREKAVEDEMKENEK